MRWDRPGQGGEATGSLLVARIDRLLQPEFRLFDIERDAMAICVQRAEIAHGEREVLLRRFLVPVGRLNVVFGHAEAVIVQGAEAVLGGGVALLGQGLPSLIGAPEVAALVGGHAGIIVRGGR